MPILPSQRHLFDLTPEVAYLNCAYMSPLAKSVAGAGHEGLDIKRRPWEVLPAHFFALTDRARRTFASLLGAPATAETIALVPAASYGMAVAAANVPVGRGRRVLALEGEFPSTILTWRHRAREAEAEFVMIPRPEDDDWTRVILEAIDERTAVAALPHCHWLDGIRIDLVRVSRRLRDVGAALVLDLTQSLGAMPFDLAAVDPDFLVAACYKWLMGPYSIGMLHVAERWHEGRPLENHWFGRAGSENFSALTGYPDQYQPGARRFDAGEPANFALLPAAIEAVERILDWGVASISDTAGALNAEIVARTEPLGFSAPSPAIRAQHYLALRAAAPLPPDLAERFAAERVYLSVRGGQSVRISPHVYNERWEVDRLVSVLERSRLGSAA